MATKYLLPCQCGQSTPIDISQAGQSIPCGCGRMLEIPTMRAIRQLQPCEEPDQAATAGPVWNPQRGSIFAVGLVAALGGLVVAGLAGYVRLHLDLRQPTAQDFHQWAATIDVAEADELWDMWLMARDHDLGPPGMSPYQIGRRQAKFLEAVILVGASVVLIGTVVAISTIAIKRKPPG